MILLCQSILETRRISHLSGSHYFTIPLSRENRPKAKKLVEERPRSLVSRILLTLKSVMIPVANTISGKASVASVNGTGGSEGHSETLSGGFRKIVEFKDHLDWLEIDFNGGEIIIA